MVIIEIRLCNPMTYDFKGQVKFHVSVLIRLKIVSFFANAKYIQKCHFK